MKIFLRSAVAILAILAIIGAIILVVGVGLPWIFVTVIEVPWVATGIIFAAFLYFLLQLPERGWKTEGSVLLIGVVLAGTVFDMVGNPVLNAPYEALFLEPGQRLQSSAVLERIGGETHVSGRVNVVDAAGEYVRTPNWFLVAAYRALTYFVLYSVVLTMSGFFPKPAVDDKTDKTRARRNR